MLARYVVVRTDDGSPVAWAATIPEALEHMRDIRPKVAPVELEIELLPAEFG